MKRFICTPGGLAVSLFYQIMRFYTAWVDKYLCKINLVFATQIFKYFTQRGAHRFITMVAGSSNNLIVTRHTVVDREMEGSKGKRITRY